MAATVKQISVRFTADTAGIDQGLKQLDNKIKAQQERMKSNLNTWGTALTAGLLAAGGMAVNAYANFEALNNGLIAVAGGAAQAEIQMTRLKEVAKMPGLDLTGAVRMSVSLQATGMAAKDAEQAISVFGNALATAGRIGDGSLEGVALALTQIMSKGKVMAQEINQIGERVPQIRTAMKSAFGTADTEVLQKMGLSSEQFISGVVKELGRLPKVTGGMKNDLENMKDSVNQAAVALGQAFAPQVSAAMADVVLLANAIRDLTDSQKAVLVITTEAIVGLLLLAKTIETIISVSNTFKTAYIAMMAPIEAHRATIIALHAANVAVAEASAAQAVAEEGLTVATVAQTAAVDAQNAAFAAKMVAFRAQIAAEKEFIAVSLVAQRIQAKQSFQDYISTESATRLAEAKALETAAAESLSAANIQTFATTEASVAANNAAVAAAERLAAANAEAAAATTAQAAAAATQSATTATTIGSTIMGLLTKLGSFLVVLTQLAIIAAGVYAVFFMLKTLWEKIRPPKMELEKPVKDAAKELDNYKNKLNELTVGKIGAPIEASQGAANLIKERAKINDELKKQNDSLNKKQEEYDDAYYEHSTILGRKIHELTNKNKIKEIANEQEKADAIIAKRTEINNKLKSIGYDLMGVKNKDAQTVEQIKQSKDQQELEIKNAWELYKVKMSTEQGVYGEKKANIEEAYAKEVETLNKLKEEKNVDITGAMNIAASKRDNDIKKLDVDTAKDKVDEADKLAKTETERQKKVFDNWKTETFATHQGKIDIAKQHAKELSDASSIWEGRAKTQTENKDTAGAAESLKKSQELKNKAINEAMKNSMSEAALALNQENATLDEAAAEGEDVTNRKIAAWNKYAMAVKAAAADSINAQREEVNKQVEASKQKMDTIKSEIQAQKDKEMSMVGFTSLQSSWQKSQEVGAKQRYAEPALGKDGNVSMADKSREYNELKQQTQHLGKVVQKLEELITKSAGTYV